MLLGLVPASFVVNKKFFDHHAFKTLQASIAKTPTFRNYDVGVDHPPSLHTTGASAVSTRACMVITTYTTAHLTVHSASTGRCVRITQKMYARIPDECAIYHQCAHLKV